MAVQKAGQRLMTLVLFALFLLMGSALVEGPEAPPRPPRGAPPISPMLARAECLTAETAAAASAVAISVRRFFRPAAEAAAGAACVREADGNGYPITGRTYVRTVYAACPLEDMPG